MLNLLEQTQNKAPRNSVVLILPFSTSAKDRTLPFTREMEEAAILIMAESDRRKGEGLILKKPAEELTFITKLFYPIWLVPWSGKTLFFDGLGESRHIIQYEVLPDIKTFINDIQGSATTRQAYSAALSDHLHHFEELKGIEEKTLPGLIANPEALQAFPHYLIEGEEAEQSEIQEISLSSNINESSILSSLSDISDLKTTLEQEIQNLREAMKLLNNATKQHVDMIREETRKIQAGLNEQIAEAKSSAIEKIRQIQEKYDIRILKTSQRFEKQLQELHQERAKLDKSLDRATGKIDRCDVEIQESKIRKDALSERRWRDEKETWKNEASVQNKNLEALDKQIETTESHKKIEIANIRAEFNAQSEEAMKEVRDLEAERDSKIQLSQQEVKTLEDFTSIVLGQLDTVTKKKRASIEELDRIGIKEQRRKTILAYVPFFLSCLRAEGRRRYVVYPPSIVETMKTTTRLKGILGMSKLGSLFQPRSRAIASVLTQAAALAERDPVFEKELHDIGLQANMLKTPESREQILEGLSKLRNEEWISANEAQTLSTLLKPDHQTA